MTARTPQTLDEVAACFRHARGEQADEDWARAVAVRLVLDEVREPLIRDALFDLVPVLEDAQEPAEVLFGHATEWAGQRQADWRAEGTPARAPSSPSTVRGFVYGGLVGAAVAAPIFGLLRMIADGWMLDLTLGHLLFPLILSLGIVGFQALWNWLSRHRARAAAITIAATALIGFSAAVASLLFLLDDSPLWRASGFWMIAVGAGYGLLALLTRWLWPLPDQEGPQEQRQDDLAWKRSLAAHLRERGDMPEARLRAIVADAERHSAESGRSLQAEFGSPASYAVRFAPDEAVRARRSAWGGTMLTLAPLVVFVLYGLDDGWHWQGRFVALALWFVAAAVLATSQWRRALSAR